MRMFSQSLFNKLTANTRMSLSPEGDPITT